MKVLDALKGRFFPYVVALVAFGGGGAATYKYLSSDCCAVNAPCCGPGAACCLKHRHEHQARAER